MDGRILRPESYEEELTSYVALNMQESITDPQIILSGGKIHLYGTVVSPIEAPIAAIFTRNGRRSGQLTVEAVALSGFPIPETFVDSFAQQ